MKTKPMAHQVAGEAALDANPKFFAMAAEQGTGKTWMLLNDAERQFIAGRITGLLVVAPKGVHTNWVRREMPTHMSVRAVGEFYFAGGGVKRKAKLNKIISNKHEDTLVVFAINIDALNTKDGFAAAQKFLMTHEACMVIDESSRIKNLTAERTKRCIKLGKLARSRRIASGTMITNSPLDLFAQFQFLSPDKPLLGTSSYRAFVAEYAELVPKHSPMVQDIIRRTGKEPQIVARDKEGNPIWRNIDKLQRMIAPYTFRVLKKDCLDLPEKIYKTAYFELSPAQRKVYEKMRDELRYERDNGKLDKFTALTKLTKLRQITSGFVMVDGEATHLQSDNPRLALLEELLEDVPCQFIVWATFREEIAQICAMLQKNGISFVEYHGGVHKDAREEAIDRFQSGAARAFVGNAQSGGIGLTLTNAQQAFYYSQSFSLEERLQSEDRCHRIGTKTNVLYTDLCALDTIDERITSALQRKADVATAILDSLD